MPTARHSLAILITAFALNCLTTQSVAGAEPKSTDRARQKQQAEQERTELRRKLDDLKMDIVKTEKAHDHAADALASGSPQNNSIVPATDQIVALYDESW